MKLCFQLHGRAQPHSRSTLFDAFRTYTFPAMKRRLLHMVALLQDPDGTAGAWFRESERFSVDSTKLSESEPFESHKSHRICHVEWVSCHVPVTFATGRSIQASVSAVDSFGISVVVALRSIDMACLSLRSNSV